MYHRITDGKWPRIPITDSNRNQLAFSTARIAGRRAAKSSSRKTDRAMAK